MFVNQAKRGRYRPWPESRNRHYWFLERLVENWRGLHHNDHWWIASPASIPSDFHLEIDHLEGSALPTDSVWWGWGYIHSIRDEVSKGMAWLIFISILFAVVIGSCMGTWHTFVQSEWVLGVTMISWGWGRTVSPVWGPFWRLSQFRVLVTERWRGRNQSGKGLDVGSPWLQWGDKWAPCCVFFDPQHGHRHTWWR